MSSCQWLAQQSGAVEKVLYMYILMLSGTLTPSNGIVFSDVRWTFCMYIVGLTYIYSAEAMGVEFLKHLSHDCLQLPSVCIVREK